MTARQTTDRIRRAYRKQAPRYDRAMRVTSRLFDIDGGRRWVCDGARGHTLEIGVGTGLNLAFYPSDVALTALDLTPEMLDQARRRAAALGRAVALCEGDATQLPFPDASFDTVTSTLTLCTIANPEAAVREAWRVLRPGGELRFFEHGRGNNRVVVLIQRLLEPLTLRFEADHLLLEPDRVFAEAGVSVEVVHRTRLGVFWRLLAKRPTS
ncbi:MAG: class I SAM-dependent methyltransferase [Candidatus Dormibacteraeota bacterium]|uniref:Class I SAM-dependent methyltransferase n=1 Tax=Candidatus Aeolococcus gillhamiae TaxID=3127015 RepID=A0A934N712_9BACT|nr:class I SAM-dependent methyltransferase [Candidatus Dormibacteraeota bacterium]